MEVKSARLQKLESDLVQASLESASKDQYLKTKDEKIERLQNQIINMVEPEEHIIDMPEFQTEELKKALKLADTYTMETLAQFLKIDNYEIVKNLAKITNRTNAAETIAYRDGALRSNEGMIKILRESIKWKTYVNRVTGEVERTRKEKEKKL